MNKEINRYCCLKEMRYTLPKNHKMHASLIRLIMIEKTFSDLEQKDPVIPEFNHEKSCQLFLSEIKAADVDNVFKSQDELDNLMTKLRNISQKYINIGRKKRRDEEGRLKSYLDNAGRNFIFEYIKKGKKSSKPFQLSIPKEVCDFLREKLETDIEFKDAIFLVWLRYINLSNWDDTYQLRISSLFHRFLSNEFDVKLELFSSPINAQFPFYGSLFYDVDRHFGSLGSYTDLIHNPSISGVIEINPPYVEYILMDVVKKITHEMSLENRKLGYILFMPFWTDAESYQMVEKSLYLRKSFIPNKMSVAEESKIFSFYSEQEGRSYNVGRRTCLFILMNDMIWEEYKTKVDYAFKLLA